MFMLHQTDSGHLLAWFVVVTVIYCQYHIQYSLETESKIDFQPLLFYLLKRWGEGQTI